MMSARVIIMKKEGECPTPYRAVPMTFYRIIPVPPNNKLLHTTHCHILLIARQLCYTAVL